MDRDPRIDPRPGDVIRLRYYDFDGMDSDVHVQWAARYPGYEVGTICPQKQPYNPHDVTRVPLWAFREWAKDATVIRRAEEAE